RQIFCVERRKKTVGAYPDTDAFDEDVAIHRYARMQICPEYAVVFGIDAAQIRANACHAADAVGQKDEGVQVRCSEFGVRICRKKTDRGGNIFQSRGITFQNQFNLSSIFLWRKTSNVAVENGDGLDMLRGSSFTLFVSDFERGSKRRIVLDQQPMAGRHECN